MLATVAELHPETRRHYASTLLAMLNHAKSDWEEVTLDPTTLRGTFRLNRHKNVNKGIKARGCLARELVQCLLSIRPANASGPIHVADHASRAAHA
ncbi:MAG TPA: hypothetical protein VII75_00035 [Thermoanaerobaculia bacterium]